MKASRIATVLAAALMLGACAGQEEKPSTQDMTQAIRDFIEVRGLEEINALKTGNHDGWTLLSDRFILYEGRRDIYLVEFVRRCHELTDNMTITPDKRWDANRIRARHDTIRGCRIAKIYALADDEIAELENIGDAPGEHS